MGNKDNIQKWVDHYTFQLYEDSITEYSHKPYDATPIEGINFWIDIKGLEDVEFISSLGTRFQWDGGTIILNGKKITYAYRKD